MCTRARRLRICLRRTALRRTVLNGALDDGAAKSTTSRTARPAPGGPRTRRLSPAAPSAGRTPVLAALLRRPADRPAARRAGHGPARPGGRRPARLRRAARHPAPAVRTRPAAPVDAATVAVTWAGHASWVIAHRRAHRPHRPGLVPPDPRHPRQDHPRRRPLGGPAADRRGRHQPQPLRPPRRPTLRRLPRDTPLFVPAGLARWCQRRAFHPRHRARLVGGGRTARPRRRPVRFDFVPAHHWSKRTLTDTCRSLWGGWVLTDARRAAGPLRGGHRLRPLVRGDRPPLPRHRPGPAPHRRLRPALVAQRRAHRPGGGRPGLPGPRGAEHGADALGDVRALRGAGPGTAHRVRAAWEKTGQAARGPLGPAGRWLTAARPRLSRPGPARTLRFLSRRPLRVARSACAAWPERRSRAEHQRQDRPPRPPPATAR